MYTLAPFIKSRENYENNKCLPEFGNSRRDPIDGRSHVIAEQEFGHVVACVE